MKKHFLNLILLTVISFQAQIVFANQIFGEIKTGDTNSEYVFLYRYIGTNFFKYDSTKIKVKGDKSTYAFSMSNNANEVFRIGTKLDNSLEFFYDKSPTKLSLDFSDTKPKANTTNITNSHFQDYRQSEARYDQTMKQLSQEMSQLNRQKITQSQKDSIQQNIIARFHQLNNNRTEEMKQLHAKSSNTLLKEICELFIIDTLTQSTFLNKTQFENQ